MTDRGLFDRITLYPRVSGIRGEGGNAVQPTTTIPDTPEGFAQFYRMLFRRDLPLHTMRWVRELYAAHQNGKA